MVYPKYIHYFEIKFKTVFIKHLVNFKIQKLEKSKKQKRPQPTPPTVATPPAPAGPPESPVAGAITQKSPLGLNPENPGFFCTLPPPALVPVRFRVL